MIEIHETDKEYLRLIREHINKLLSRAAELYDNAGATVLEIGPGEYDGAKTYFKKADVFTVDISPDSGADYIMDICYGHSIGVHDVIVCTDVLEHTVSPRDAIDWIYWALKTNGILVLSTPLNFRIHGMGGYSPQGPPADYWRFTESGLRLLLKDVDILEIDALESDRPLFPIHYALIAQKKDG